jgi:hypothetical protein
MLNTNGAAGKTTDAHFEIDDNPDETG